MKRFFRPVSVLIAAILVMSSMAAGLSAFADDLSYTDVTESRWSYPSIMYASEKGYMNGTGNGKFTPAGTMTRSMVATVLYRIDGAPVVEYSPVFSDIPEGKWYTDAVIWAKEAGVVNGTSDTMFSPEGKITREQLVTMLYRFCGYCKYKTEVRADLTGYSDSGKIHTYAADAFSWAVGAGLISGMTKTELSPLTGATREQFATILERFDKMEFDYVIEYNPPQLISQYTEPERKLVEDADIYVSVTGDDSDPGTFEKPIATFSHARELVKELQPDATDPIVVAFMAGNYGYLDESFDRNDSGTEQAPVVYCAYGDGDVIFSNSVEIKLEEFEPIDEDEYHFFPSNKTGSIYKADISDRLEGVTIDSSCEMYMGNERGYAACYPNRDPDGLPMYINLSLAVEDSLDTVKFIGPLKSLMDKAHTFENVIVNGQLSYEWLYSKLTIKSYDPETGYVTFNEPLEYISRDDSFSHRICLENMSELLDSEGEYWINTDTGIIYVYEPKSDCNISYGENFIYADRLSYTDFIGLEFRYTNNRMLQLRNLCSHINVRDCKFIGCGGEYAVQTYYCTDVTISGCEIGTCAATGLIVCTDTSGTILDSNVVVTNNYVHDYGQIDRSYCGGITFWSSNNAVVSHNEITRGPHVAMMVEGHGNVVEYNNFHDVVQDSGDMGCIYMGRSFSQAGNTIRYNLFENVEGPFGIYIDDGFSGLTTYGNIFYDIGSVGVMMSGGKHNEVYDSVFIRSYGDPGEAIRGWDKYIEGIVDGEMTFGSYNGRHSTLGELPKEGDPAYEVWSGLWPWLYSINPDYNALDDPDNEAIPSGCVIKNNYLVNTYENVQEYTAKFGEYVPGTVIGLDENPIFVNPAKGDYSIRDDVEGIYIPFEKIGRY